MKGPPITVKCDCGQVQDVPYGERWECPGCGRRWNTGQILVGGAIAIAVFGFTLWTGQSVIPMAMIAMTFWLLIFMPRWRRKIRWHTRNLPKWTLHPE